MPRKARSWVPGVGAHIISRFVDRRFYLADEVDRRLFLDAIGRAAHRWDWRWVSWALMSSHVHSGHLAGRDGPERFFRSAHTRYAHAYHSRRPGETLGPVFADRPALYAVASSDLPRVVAYHHRNPVSAGVVLQPRQSTWTSHRVYLRLDPAPTWFDVEWALDLLGFRDTEAGRRQFDEFVTEVDLDDRPPLHESRPRPSPVSGYTAADLKDLIAIARDVAGLRPDEKLGSRCHRAALTRRLVAIVGSRDLGQTYAMVGEQLGVRATSVFNLVERSRPRELEGMLAEARRRLARRTPEE